MVTPTQSKIRKTSRTQDDRSHASPDIVNTSSMSDKLTKSKKGKTPKSVNESRSQGDDVRLKEVRMTELTDEIRSKERTLALLDEALPSDPTSKQLLAQLQLRDKRIEELNLRIQDLEAQLAGMAMDNVVAKEKQLSQMQEEKVKLMKELQGLEEHSGNLESQLNALQKELTETKENSELLQEGLSEECEQMRSTVAQKENVLKSAKQDILQLSKIVGEMSKLNSELNEKILVQNGEMEKLNTAHYQANAKALHADELESAYTELRTDYQKSLNKNKKLNEENARLRRLEDISRVCQEKLKSAEDQLQATFEPATILDLVQQVRHELKANTTVKTSVPDDPSLLKQEINELKDNVKELSLQTRKATSNEAAHLERIKFMEGEKLTIKQQLEEAVERLQKRMKMAQDGFEKQKAKADQLEQDLGKSNLDLQKSSTQLLSVQSQLNLLKMNRKEVAQVETKLQATVKDLKGQVNLLKSQRAAQESSISAREHRLKMTATKLKVLTDEAWKRDTELMKAKRALGRLEDELTRIKSTEQVSHAKAKTKIAEEMTSVNGQLEEKDREIAILRDMIRSTQQQMKTKENEVNRLKRRYESDPVREPSSPVHTSGSGLAKLALKLDSCIKEIEDLLNLKTKLSGEGKMPVATIKKLLLMDQIPKDKATIQEVLAQKLAETTETLTKFATSKQSFSISIEHLSGKPASALLQEMLNAQDSVQVADVLGRIKSFVID